jgi:hypothetical protein
MQKEGPKKRKKSAEEDHLPPLLDKIRKDANIGKAYTCRAHREED